MKLTSIFILFFITTYINSQSLKDCSTCSTNLVKSTEIQNLSIDEIRLLTNEIFARNGFQFENNRFQIYFEGENWYQSKKDNNKVVFNGIEKQNIKLFQEQTSKLERRRDDIIRQLKDFINLAFTNNRSELKKLYGFQYERKDDPEEPQLLNQVLKRLDLNNINYYKNSGFYSVKVDNGFVKIMYQLHLQDKKVFIRYNRMTHSEIIKDFDEFTDYHSENELMYEWQFNLENGQLKYVRLAIAG